MESAEVFFGQATRLPPRSADRRVIATAVTKRVARPTAVATFLCAASFAACLPCLPDVLLAHLRTKPGSPTRMSHRSGLRDVLSAKLDRSVWMVSCCELVIGLKR